MPTTSDDNFTRTERAAHLAAELQTYTDGWDIRTNLIAVLTDARHWCDAHGESLADLDRIAHQHYFAELGDELEKRP